MSIKNPFEKIYNTYQYAIDNNIDPLNPDTWDVPYKARQMELAGILPGTESELIKLKEVLQRIK